MQAYKFNTRSGDYFVELKDTGKIDRYGKHIIGYVLCKPDFDKGDRGIIFSGDDLHCSPMNKPESIECAVSLLAFLTLKEGDTDQDYFDNYTTDQLVFSQSDDCEDLANIIHDFEDKQRGWKHAQKR